MNQGDFKSEIVIHNGDCVPFMKGCKDNQFDLAIEIRPME